MSLYRVKQFIWVIKSMVEDIDTYYLDKFLDENEIKLFNRLQKSDKQHCIRVCKEAIEIAKNSNVSKERIAKAALLHDIGKSEYKLNLMEKSILVILNKITKGKIKKYYNIKQIDIYYNHADKGAKMLKEFNVYDKEFLEAVKNHHRKIDNSNELLKIIKESDDRN